MTLSDLSLSGGETMVEIDFNALSLDESSFVYRQHAFSIHRIPHSDPGYWEYELTLDETPVGRAVCQPSSLIQQHLTTPQSAALYIDPILIHLYGGHCHWIETIQILPPSRGQGYGSVWLESLCALLQSEAKLPIALYPDEWWDDSTPLQGHHLDQWYERHGFLKFPGTDSFMKLRVRDDGDRTVTLERIQTMMAEVAASLHDL